MGAATVVFLEPPAFAARHRPDEMMLTANIFDHAARLRSFELAMQAWQARH